MKPSEEIAHILASPAKNNPDIAKSVQSGKLPYDDMPLLENYLLVAMALIDAQDRAIKRIATILDDLVP